MNKTCLPLSKSDYELLISTIRNGYILDGHKVRGNQRVASALVCEACTGLRIGDELRLKLTSIAKIDDNLYFNLVEEKTKKRRSWPFSNDLYVMLQDYAITRHISKDEKLFDIKERQVSRVLESAVKYLNWQDKNIGTHSFRKMYASHIYDNTDHNIFLTSQALQHSNVTVTQHYLNITPEELKAVLEDTVNHFIM